VPAFIDGPFDGMLRRERSDSQQRLRRVGSAAECDGLEDFPSAHMIGISNRRALGLSGTAHDKLQSQVSSGPAWLGSLSKSYLHFFNELFLLRLRETNCQPGETRQ
jgi:hypothetical protein